MRHNEKFQFDFIIIYEIGPINTNLRNRNLSKYIVKMFSAKHDHHRNSWYFGQQLNRLNMEGKKTSKRDKKEVL